MGKTQRKLQSEQIRFMSPERGVLHSATCAVLNAIWDLWTKVEGKPLWKLVTDMTVEELVKCVDFRYLTDVLMPTQAVEMPKAKEKGKKERIKDTEVNRAAPAYNTSVG